MSYSHTMPRKDPAADLAYEIEWTDWLGEGETIAAYEVTCPDDTMTINDHEIEGDVIRWRLSDGVNGRDYLVTIEINTSAGNTDQRTVNIPVRDR